MTPTDLAAVYAGIVRRWPFPSFGEPVRVAGPMFGASIVARPPVDLSGVRWPS